MLLILVISYVRILLFISYHSSHIHFAPSNYALHLFCPTFLPSHLPWSLLSCLLSPSSLDPFLVLLPKHPLASSSASFFQYRNNLQHLLELSRPLRTTAKPVEVINQILRVYFASVREQIVADQSQKLSAFGLLRRCRCACSRSGSRGSGCRCRRSSEILTGREV